MATVGALAVVLLLSAGCAGGGGSASSGPATTAGGGASGGAAGGAAGPARSADASYSGAAPNVAAPALPPGGAAPGNSANPTSGAPPVGAPNVGGNQTDAQRKVIRSATMTVRHADVESTTAKAREIIRQQQASVDAIKETGTGDARVATLTVKVDPEKFDETMLKFRTLGEVQQIDSGQKDVTEEVVDLEARLKAATASRDRVLEMTKKASNLNELVMLERELNTRNQEVDSLAARLRSLNAQVGQSTISLTIQSTPAAPKAQPQPGAFTGGFNAGAGVIGALARSTAALLGFLVPMLPVLALAGLGFWGLLRYRRTRQGDTATAVPAGAGGSESSTPRWRVAVDAAPEPAAEPARRRHPHQPVPTVTD